MRRLSPPLARLTDALEPYAYALIRVTAGAMLVPHGWAKLFGGGLSGTAEFMASVGIEPGMVFATYIALLELVGGALLVLGLFTRPVAIQVAGFMAVAAFYVHWADGFFWGSHGFEYPLFWGLVALAIAVKGGGRLSLDRYIGREF